MTVVTRLMKLKQQVFLFSKETSSCRGKNDPAVKPQRSKLRNILQGEGLKDQTEPLGHPCQHQCMAADAAPSQI